MPTPKSPSKVKARTKAAKAPTPPHAPAKAARPRITSTADLAAYLDLSEWTVSRAINGHPEVKQATKDRIRQAMEETGFRPNPVARSLNGKRLGIIGVCFRHTLNPVVAGKITLLDEALRRQGFQALLSINRQDEENEIRILAGFHHLRVDGVILVESYLSPAQVEGALRDMPRVYLDPSHPDLLPKVFLDRSRAMRLIVDHFVATGRSSIGLLGFSSNHRARWEGVTKAFRAHGLDTRKIPSFELPEPGRESYAEGIALAEAALAAKPLPSAFIALNDQIAAGAIQRFREAGLRVPKDLAVVGFDNIDPGRFLKPTLSTIDQQVEIQIKHTVSLLLDQFARPNDARLRERSIAVEPELVLRESSGGPA
ncbi:MAG TPA: LacI family DNA-binding transcriptional regulator [Candidatus Methylacidiphilales bacterium]